MRLVMTLVVRDEVDIVDAQIEYHLNAGVDFVLATDHDSRDGTTDILEKYARDGYLRLFHERGEMRESDWRTRMARLAAVEHGADWVINTDGDEFWMPRRGTLKQALVAVPNDVGIVWALTRHFVPRPEDGGFFAERMTVRLSLDAPLNDPTSPYRPHAKAAHRADPRIVVLFGSHDVVSDLKRMHGWHPADVLHFPFRTREQYERKGVRRARGDKPLGQYVKAFEASERGRVEDALRLPSSSTVRSWPEGRRREVSLSIRGFGTRFGRCNGARATPSRPFPGPSSRACVRLPRKQLCMKPTSSERDAASMCSTPA